jgi:hypothetical protein
MWYCIVHTTRSSSMLKFFKIKMRLSSNLLPIQQPIYLESDRLRSEYSSKYQSKTIIILQLMPLASLQKSSTRSRLN